MLTYGVLGGIVISAGFIEKQCREGGNVKGALAARRFGRWFLIGAGGWDSRVAEESKIKSEKDFLIKSIKTISFLRD